MGSSVQGVVFMPSFPLRSANQAAAYWQSWQTFMSHMKSRIFKDQKSNAPAFLNAEQNTLVEQLWPKAAKEVTL